MKLILLLLLTKLNKINTAFNEIKKKKYTIFNFNEIKKTNIVFKEIKKDLLWSIFKINSTEYFL